MLGPELGGQCIALIMDGERGRQQLRGITSRASWQALVLVLAVLAVGLPSLSMPWSLIDDGEVLRVARLMSEGDWRFLEEDSGRFRPAYWLFHWFRYELFAASAFAWHLSQVCLHVIIVLLIFAIVQDLTASRNCALLSGLLFILVSSVENLYRLGCPEPQVALCQTGSLYLLLRSRHYLSRTAHSKVGLYLGSAIVLLGLGYLAKETSFVLVPVAASMLCLTHIGEKSPWAPGWRKITAIYLGANLAFTAGTRGALYLVGGIRGYSLNYDIAAPQILASLRAHLYMLSVNGGLLLAVILTSFLVRLTYHLYKQRSLSLSLQWQMVMLVWFLSGIAVQLPWRWPLWRYLLPYWIGGSVFLGMELYEMLRLLRDTYAEGWLIVGSHDQALDETREPEPHVTRSASFRQIAREAAGIVVYYLKHGRLHLLLLLLSGVCLYVSLQVGMFLLPSYDINVGDAGDESYVRGFHQGESDEWSSFRWTKARSYVTFADAANVPATVSLSINGWRPEGQPAPLVALLANGRELAYFVADKDLRTYEFRYMPLGLSLEKDLVLEIRSTTFTPLSDEAGRTLGVLVDSVGMAPTAALLPSFYLALVALLSVAICMSSLVLRSLVPVPGGSFVGALVFLALVCLVIIGRTGQAVAFSLCFAGLCGLSYAGLVVVHLLGGNRKLDRAIASMLAGSIVVLTLLHTRSFVLLKPAVCWALWAMMAFSILALLRASDSRRWIEPYAHACLVVALALASLGFVYTSITGMFNFGMDRIQRERANKEMVEFLARNVPREGHVFLNLSTDIAAWEWYYETGLHLELFHNRDDIRVDLIDLESRQAYHEGDILLTWSRFRRYPIEELLTRFPSRIVEEKSILRTYPQVTRDPLMVADALRSILIFGDTLPVVSMHDYEWRIYRIHCQTEERNVTEPLMEAMTADVAGTQDDQGVILPLHKGRPG